MEGQDAYIRKGHGACTAGPEADKNGRPEEVACVVEVWCTADGLERPVVQPVKNLAAPGEDGLTRAEAQALLKSLQKAGRVMKRLAEED